MKEASKPSVDCCGGPLERPCYFPRQLITADDLTLEQDYFRERLRLHNRMVHGWGTICGTEVCRVPSDEVAGEPDPWRVKIKPGYLIGPYGDEIYLGCEVIVDLRTAGVEGESGDSKEAVADPWCSRVCLPREAGPLYLAVRYKECRTRPVRVQPVGCGCEGEECEYSRCRDGYEIAILDHCPESHRGDPPDGKFGSGPIPPCPPCPTDPWVVLARVEIDGNGIVGLPDNCSCRRLAAGLAPLWRRCDEPQQIPDPTYEIEWRDPNGNPLPAAEIAAGNEALFEVRGPGIDEGSKVVTGGSGVRVEAATSSTDGIRATLHVDAAAAPGPRPLRVLAADGATLVERTEAYRVVAAQSDLSVRWRKDGSFVAARFTHGDEVSVAIAGSQIASGARVELPDGFEVVSTTADEGKLAAVIRVLDSAPVGAHPIRVLDATNAVLGERDDAFRVVAREVEPSTGGSRPSRRRAGSRRGRTKGGDGE